MDCRCDLPLHVVPLFSSQGYPIAPVRSGHFQTSDPLYAIDPASPLCNFDFVIKFRACSGKGAVSPFIDFPPPSPFDLVNAFSPTPMSCIHTA